jgi:hypothetical protein
MEEEFYAVLKLVSGEELFSKVCPCEEDERIILILDNPVIIETINIKQLGMSGLKVHPWIKMSDESMFIIDMQNVLTITETKDKDLIKVHEKYIREKNRKSGKSKVTPNMGYLSSVADARINLEKIFKSN